MTNTYATCWNQCILQYSLFAYFDSLIQFGFQIFSYQNLNIVLFKRDRVQL